VGEQFFKDNFGLKVKATNVVGKDDGVEVYVHCEDHGIVFNASLPLYKDAIHQKGSMRSNDNGDDMSMMVGTVLSGFEYRAQKEKYDNLYKFLKENEKQYQYTGFTKEAINKTQNSGYENEYFYISAIPYNLAEYRDYFEPLLNKSDSEFSKELSNVKKQLKDKSKVSVTTTLFSKKKNYTKKSNSENVIKMAEEIKKDKEIPNGIELSIKFSDNKINTVKPNFNGESTSEYGVFDQE
ncbi:lipoprotein, partial [Staphylococcus aureus M42184]